MATFGEVSDDAWRERRDKRWAIFATVIGCIVAVVWSGYNTLADKSLPYNLAQNEFAYVAGTVFGHALFVCFVIFLVIYFLFVRKRVEGMGLTVYLSLLFSVLIVTGGGLALLKIYGDQQSTEVNAQQHIALNSIGAAISNLLQHPKGAVDTHIAASGDPGEAERIVKQTLAKSAQAAADYRADLAKLGFPAFLQPSQLVTAKERAAALQELEQARALSNGLQKTVIREATDERAAIAQSNISADYKAGMLASFDRSAGQAESEAMLPIEAQSEVFAELETGVKILSHTKGRWLAHGKAIAFTNPDDLVAYNAHILRLRALQQRAEASSTAVRNNLANVRDSSLHAQ